MNHKTQHRGCGGGVKYIGPAPADGRPTFQCTKCLETWTHGFDGGPWAGLISKKVLSFR